jgi:hypothetical protein
MYRVYLRQFDGQLIQEAEPLETQAAARDAFAALVNQTGYDGFELAAVLTENNRPIAVHRFDRHPGEAAFWRHRLDELPFTPLH